MSGTVEAGELAMNAPEPADLGRIRFEWNGRCEAPPETVYDALATISTALIWSGEWMPRQDFRLLALDAPAGLARAGTEWTSSGADPSGRFDDRSIVVVADRPRRLVYRTAVLYSWKRSDLVSTADLKHSWDIRADGAGGSQVSYVVLTSGLRPFQAPWNIVMATPGLRALARAMIKAQAGKAFANFLRFATSQARDDAPARVA